VPVSCCNLTAATSPALSASEQEEQDEASEQQQLQQQQQLPCDGTRTDDIYTDVRIRTLTIGADFHTATVATAPGEQEARLSPRDRAMRRLN